MVPIVRTKSLYHIEDDPLWRSLVVAVTRNLCIHHFGWAADVPKGISDCTRQAPTIVVLDLWLSGKAGGFAALEKLVGLHPTPNIILLTCRRDELTLFHAWFGKVTALVWKSPQSADHLERAILAAWQNHRHFEPEVLDAVSQFRQHPGAFHKMLSPREIALVRKFASGESDASLAAGASLPSSTIHSRRQRIMAKLGLHRTVDLIAWAMKKGFGDTPYGAENDELCYGHGGSTKDAPPV